MRFFHQADTLTAGGKGKNLVILTKAGFPVPPGFIIPYPVYQGYVKGGIISEDTRRELVDHYNELCNHCSSSLVSVRSSASCEDSATASFAGQFKSFLYVKGEEALLQGVKDCWDSLLNPVVLAYSKRLKLDISSLEMAVVIQQMIHPRVAGILFTRQLHPPSKGEVMILESSYGCGETVVSGKATPDHFVISRDEPFTPVEKLLGEKEVEWTGNETGFAETPVALERRRVFSLDEKEIALICSLGRKIEDHYGCPQDIEWAINREGRLFILQTRPITRGI